MHNCDLNIASARPGGSEFPSASRRVVTAFEAWDPSLGMVVIMNSGRVLYPKRVLPDHDPIPGAPPFRRGVEFECGGAPYLADFERIWSNTCRQEKPPLAAPNS